MKNWMIKKGWPLSDTVLKMGFHSFAEVVKHVQHLPYGRTIDRSDFATVLQEGKGTCSTKHALIKALAIEQGFDSVKLFTGIYKMNLGNTPGIGNHLEKNQVNYMPEAHCYLDINGQRLDITNPTASFDRIKADLLQEQEILPHQIGTFKVNYHQDFIRQWISQENLSLQFEEVWAIREACILELSQ